MDHILDHAQAVHISILTKYVLSGLSRQFCTMSDPTAIIIKEFNEALRLRDFRWGYLQPSVHESRLSFDYIKLIFCFKEIVIAFKVFLFARLKIILL